SPQDIPVTIIFDGKAQPNLIENPYITSLIRQPRWLTPQEFETMARQPVYDEGLNIMDWFAAEHPKAAWLGKDFSVRGQTMVVIRRRTTENLMIVGSANAARYGMLAAMVAGLTLNGNTHQMEFLILDRSIPGTAWSETLQKAVDCILHPSGYTVSL